MVRRPTWETSENRNVKWKHLEFQKRFLSPPSPSANLSRAGSVMAGITSSGGMTGFGDEPLPDVIASSVFGMRAWSLKPNQWTLHGLTKDEYIWVPGKNTAECLRNKQSTWEAQGRRMPDGSNGPSLATLHKAKEPPVAECACGFWAYWEDEGLSTIISQSDSRFVGIMEGWGRLIMGPKGFRAQYARIVALCSPEASTKYPAIRTQYPGVKWYEDIEEMIALHPAPNAFKSLFPEE